MCFDKSRIGYCIARTARYLVGVDCRTYYYELSPVACKISLRKSCNFASM